LSPTNDGSEDAPHKLIGWPCRETVSGTVDGAVSGKEKFGFYDAELTATDKGHYCSAEIEFTSGSNNGLKRKVIFYQYDSDNSRGEVYVFPDLPNNISAGDQYTITLETEFWSDRPQPGQDAGWDNDDYVRPVLDGGNGSFDMFSFDADSYWEVVNLHVKNTSDDLFDCAPRVLKNVLVSDGGYYLRCDYAQVEYNLEDVYGWNITNGIYINLTARLLNVHVQSGRGLRAQYGTRIRLKNCSFGKVNETNRDISITGWAKLNGECIELCSSTPVYQVIDQNDSVALSYPLLAISGYNGEPNKFHQWWRVGEIYNVDEDATIDPPSGATTYIKLVPNSHCNSIYPLVYENHRNVSSGSKTYTWKFRPTGWSSLSTSDIEIEVWFLEESSGTKRKYGSANPSTVTNDSWNDLQITFSPGQEGVAYFKIKVKKYESGAWIALDPKPNDGS